MHLDCIAIQLAWGSLIPPSTHPCPCGPCVQGGDAAAASTSGTAAAEGPHAYWTAIYTSRALPVTAVGPVAVQQLGAGAGLLLLMPEQSHRCLLLVRRALPPLMLPGVAVQAYTRTAPRTARHTLLPPCRARARPGDHGRRDGR
jgi:hypothetical protein